MVVITSPEFSRTSTFFSWLLNGFISDNIIKADSVWDTVKQIGNTTKEAVELKNQIAIFDLSRGHKFKDIHPSIISTESEDNSPSWLKNYFTLKSIMPNLLFQNTVSDAWSKNFSQTIWIASSVDEIPKVLLSNYHLLWLTEQAQFKEFLKVRFGADADIADDSIFVVSSTITRDPNLMRLSRSKFIRQTRR